MDWIDLAEDRDQWRTLVDPHIRFNIKQVNNFGYCYALIAHQVEF
jgi:hypothetical protein